MISYPSESGTENHPGFYQVIGINISGKRIFAVTENNELKFEEKESDT